MYLAIDYGKKFIGLANSDESGTLAFPLIVLPNDKKLFLYIEKTCKEKDITDVVMGDSIDQKGEKNTIAKEAEEFANEIKTKLNLPVHFQKEGFTSMHAREGLLKGKRVDAGAAALILQRYLDRKNH